MPRKEQVVKEYPAIGKYRIRVVENGSPQGGVCLDVREYLKTDRFEGFTRRGVRFYGPAELGSLREILGDVMASGAMVKGEAVEPAAVAST